MLYLQLIFELPFNANQVQPEPVYEASGDESSGDNINTDDEDLSKPESQMLNTIPNQDSSILEDSSFQHFSGQKIKIQRSEFRVVGQKFN